MDVGVDVGGSGCEYVWVSREVGYVFCCDNFYYGFSFLTFFFNPLCLIISINLNVFDVALIFFFFLTSLIS